MISIQDMYVQANKITTHGVEGYHVDNKYVNSYEKSKTQQSELKRGSYLDDYAKVHNYIPGPGVYNYTNNQWPSKSKIKKAKPAHKKTYIDEVIQRQKKEKRPAPGQYKLQKSLKQMEKEKKELARKKKFVQDRITYLDGVQYEATQTPGVGKYNTRIRPKSSTTYNKRKGDKPQEWRKKHEVESKIAKKKGKQPDMGSYNPKQVKSYERRITKEGDWNKVKRFQDGKSGSGLGPGKYIEIDNWKKRPASAPRVPHKSVYYN